MTKQLKMINKDNALIITNSKSEELFSISLIEMTFNSQLFYDKLFSKIKAKIEYKLINKINQKEVEDYKKCLRIYDVVNKLIDDIQTEINKNFS